MKQLILNLHSGRVSVENIGIPLPKSGQILVRSSYSLVSLGTERMLVDFGSSNWLQRVRQHPEKVRLVMRKIMLEGVKSTLISVANKLEQPHPLGYSQTGVVVEVGKGVSGFRVGDRVATNGPHAEYVCVNENQAVRVPEGVSDEQAAFTSMGGVALQSIRLLNPTLGETVVVTGLGLIGFLVALLLKANGCKVIGLDPDREKRLLADRLGWVTMDPACGNVVGAVLELTGGQGTDGVIITASSGSDTLISEAARMSRKRGRIVLTGTTGLTLKRADFYEKELSFQVSCSHGPGRYEAAYEEKGLDYPIGFVRWTLNRNFQAFLQLIESGRLDVSPLITATVPINEANSLYTRMEKLPGTGYLVKYTSEEKLDLQEHRVVALGIRSEVNHGVRVGIIGAGNFSKMTLLPALKGIRVEAISSASGVSGAFLASKYQMKYSTTDYVRILEDPAIDLVIIATRHDLHAEITMQALKAGKHVLTEKPMAIFQHELEAINTVLLSGVEGNLIVGFNRRFSVYVRKVRQLLSGDPVNIIATVNAGSLDAKSWQHDRNVGGGRIVGEACHLIDLMRYLAQSPICEVCANYAGESPDVTSDNAVVMLRFENGSTGTLHYFSNGSNEYQKERIEIYGNGKTLVLDDFRALRGFGFKGFSKMKGKVDKGHKNMLREVVLALENGQDFPVPKDHLLNVSRASLAIYDSFVAKAWVSI